MTVGRNAAQCGAVFARGDVHVDAVQVVTGFFRRDREFRFIEQAAENWCRCSKVRRVVGRRHHGEIFFGKGREAKVRTTCFDGQTTFDAVFGQGDQRAIGQFANDFVQGNGGDRGGASAFDHCGCFINDFDVEVGGTELNAIAFGFDQDVGQNWNSVPAFNNRLGLCDCLEQNRAFDTEFHVPRSASRT